MSDFLRKGLKINHLRLVAALRTEGKLAHAALMLGISQPAASRLASEIEAIIGARPYHRTGRGVELTPQGMALANRAERVLKELDEASREIGEITQGVAGKVSIGSVTGPAIEYIIPALNEARTRFPNVHIEVVISTSQPLGDMVKNGVLDLAFARLPRDESADRFAYSDIGPEPISIIARRDHPAFALDLPARIESLLEFDWVVPVRGQILRESVEHVLKVHGVSLPARTINTSSFLFVLAVISQSNAIAPVASSVARMFSGELGIRELPCQTDFTVESYGILRRADSPLSPAAEAVFRILRDKARPDTAA